MPTFPADTSLPSSTPTSASIPASASARRGQPPQHQPPRVLIFIVAYNARTTLGWVLDRIPTELHNPNVEVLVIDDSSPDDTFRTGLDYVRRHAADTADGLKVTILRTPENQGYGGNQKLGYRYALDHGFDHVALVHGDGQYAPEKLPELLAPLLAGEADAVFGSRMLRRQDALRGGMPLYKWLGNQVLTRFQNQLLGSALSEFHSGYRLYSARALRRIPFERNTDDFHFDTEIIVQLHLAGLRIKELPIPTYYGDEICRVNGLKYAWDVVKTMLRVRVHRLDLMYDRRFDVGPAETQDVLKLDFPSSHTLAMDAVRPDAEVLNVTGSRGANLSPALSAKGCRLTGIGQRPPTAPTTDATTPQPQGTEFIPWSLDASEFPVDISRFDQILLLDVIEHLRDPERFMEELCFAARGRRPEVILTTANVGFFIPRLMLLLGQFNYGRRGILDRTHTRLFTFRSLTTLLRQAGYEVTETRGVPAPFPLVTPRHERLGSFLLKVNQFLIGLSRRWFAYQIFVRARIRPSVHHLLERTVETSETLRQECLARTAVGVI